jgi:hypothetical protein
MKLAPKFVSQLGLIVLLATATCAYAQENGDVVYQTQAPVPNVPGPVSVGTVAVGGMMKGSITPIKGAPYSATITNESVQTLADGNRIVQTSTGNTARDSQGRTRQDFALPAIGNLSAADVPRLVFIQDPVAQTSYTLNLTDKTAQKIPMPPPPPGGGFSESGGVSFSVQTGAAVAAIGPGTLDRSIPGAGPEQNMAFQKPVPPDGAVQTMAFAKLVSADEHAQVTTEDLGSQTMEGVVVNGTRTTRTIPAGQIGNDRPIVITTEVWISPDLNTIISSKRNDPRMGEQTFKLTNLVRTEPDASLFAPPPDFKVLDGPQRVMYHANR